MSIVREWYVDAEERNGVLVPPGQWASLICALQIALEAEEFTREESVLLIAAWLRGGCPR